MPTKSEVLFRDSAGYHKIDLKLNPEMAIYTGAAKYLEQLDNVCGTCLKPLKGKMFYPMNPPKCQDCIQIQRFSRSFVARLFTWEHIAERLEIRQVLHSFGWPRTPFAELLKRQAQDIRGNRDQSGKYIESDALRNSPDETRASYYADFAGRERAIRANA